MSVSKEFDAVILIVDLSGYTALTEAHGKRSSAEVVTRYAEIVKNALLPDTNLVERVGDEVLIIGTDATNVLRTAISIRDSIDQEPFFLDVHAGIHAGNILEQDGHYFGSALNLTSRVANHARGGQILCTKQVYDLSSYLKGVQFRSMGTVQFKNIIEPVDIFEVETEGRRYYATLIDPVCQMHVSPDTAPARLPFEGKTYYFCSLDCAKAFAVAPDRYVESLPDKPFNGSPIG